MYPSDLGPGNGLPHYPSVPHQTNEGFLKFNRKGDSLIEGVPQTLANLRALGKSIFFVTNNSAKSRKGFLTKFHSLGLVDVKAEGIVNKNGTSIGLSCSVF